jgi:DNA polymerase-3 subunit epsilon
LETIKEEENKMIITGLDFETNGLTDPRMVAVGMAMYDVTPGTPDDRGGCDVKNSAFSIQATSFIVNPGDVPFEAGAILTHGITPDIALKYGRDEGDAGILINDWLSQSDYVVAYNGNSFDKAILKAASLRSGIPVPYKTWIDPFVDIEAHDKADDLTGQCAKHGFLVGDAHTALADVSAMMRLLLMHDINRLIEIAASPMVYLRADVTYDEKDLAKNRGYKWDKPNMPKSWVLETREMFMQKEIDEAPFGLDIAKNGKWEFLRPKKSAHPGVVEI